MVLLAITWPKEFPATANARRSTHAGPAPGLTRIAQLSIRLPLRKFDYSSVRLLIAIGSRVYDGPSIWAN